MCPFNASLFLFFVCSDMGVCWSRELSGHGGWLVYNLVATASFIPHESQWSVKHCFPLSILVILPAIPGRRVRAFFALLFFYLIELVTIVHVLIYGELFLRQDYNQDFVASNALECLGAGTHVGDENARFFRVFLDHDPTREFYNYRGSVLVGSGRVGSGRVGSGRVGSGRVGSGRVRSGRVRRYSEQLSVTGHSDPTIT